MEEQPQVVDYEAEARERNAYHGKSTFTSVRASGEDLSPHRQRYINSSSPPRKQRHDSPEPSSSCVRTEYHCLPRRDSREPAIFLSRAQENSPPRRHRHDSPESDSQAQAQDQSTKRKERHDSPEPVSSRAKAQDNGALRKQGREPFELGSLRARAKDNIPPRNYRHDSPELACTRERAQGTRSPQYRRESPEPSSQYTHPF